MIPNEMWTGFVASVLQSSEGRSKVWGNVVWGVNGNSTLLGHVTSALEIYYLLIVSIYLLSD